MQMQTTMMNNNNNNNNYGRLCGMSAFGNFYPENFLQNIPQIQQAAQHHNFNHQAQFNLNKFHQQQQQLFFNDNNSNIDDTKIQAYQNQPSPGGLSNHSDQIYAVPSPLISPGDQVVVNQRVISPMQQLSPNNNSCTSVQNFGRHQTSALRTIDQNVPISSQTRPQTGEKRKLEVDDQNNSSTYNNNNIADCPRPMKIPKREPYSGESYQAQNQRVMANIREKERTLCLNKAFADLRKVVPSFPTDKNSKKHTLHTAKSYIDFLHAVLFADPQATSTTGSQQTGGRSQKSSVLSARQEVETLRSSACNVPTALEKLSYHFGFWRMESDLNMVH